MDKVEARKLIEKTPNDYNQMQRVLRGLQILAKYDVEQIVSFDYDQLYVSDFDETVVNMTKEEVIELAMLGWYESQDSWSHL